MENRHELSLEISYVLLQDQEACKGAEHELLQSVKNPSRDVPKRLGGEKGKKEWKKFLLQLQDQKKLGEFLPLCASIIIFWFVVLSLLLNTCTRHC